MIYALIKWMERSRECVEMKYPGVCAVVIFTLTTISCGGSSKGGNTDEDGGNTSNSTLAQLGREVFFDSSLSSGGNQSCATCHDPAKGFADPLATETSPVSQGSVGGEFGSRNAPTIAYTSFSPIFGLAFSQTVETDSKYEGGQFVDGRAINLVEQAKAPFLNPVEMNNVDAADVVSKVQNAGYADDFKLLFGADVFDDVSSAYTRIAEAITAFEESAEVNQFTSKFDAYLAGQYTLTASEQRGFDLFKDPDGAKCANCHTVGDTSEESLFTDYKYYNVGTPPNIYNPANIADMNFIDNGLGGSGVIDSSDQALEAGKFKVPTLRNVELTAPYMHNGVFNTLEEVVQHYDVFAVFPSQAEVATNIAVEMGDLDNFVGLNLDTVNDYDDLVNFMKALTDGYF